MDDSEPRRDEAGAHPPSLQILSPVTVLADGDETAAEALEDWSRGLDWVHWLFSSVRQRLPHLHFAPPSLTRLHGSATVAQLRLASAWDAFAETTLVHVLGPAMTAAWQAVQRGDATALMNLDRGLAAQLPGAMVQPSLEAGSLLLRSTRGARYQGMLGRYRSAQEEGSTPGHFIFVWAAVGHFFQLGRTNVIAEYLRLEWDMAARHVCRDAQPLSLEKLTRLTSRLMDDVREERLRVVA